MNCSDMFALNAFTATHGHSYINCTPKLNRDSLRPKVGAIYATAKQLEQFQLNHSITFIKELIEEQNIVGLSNKHVIFFNIVIAINKRWHNNMT